MPNHLRPPSPFPLHEFALLPNAVKERSGRERMEF